MIETTEWARDILTKSFAAARRFNPTVQIRLTVSDGTVQAVLAETSEPDDQKISIGDLILYAEPGLSGLLDIEEPHDRLVLRPAGSVPNERGH